MPQTQRTDRLMHRICQDYIDELSNLNIPVEVFIAGNDLVLHDKYTPAQVSTIYGFSVGEQDDFNALLARVTAYSDTINTNKRDRAVGAIRAMLILYELRQDYPVPGYTTPEEVWTNLMTI